MWSLLPLLSSAFESSLEQYVNQWLWLCANKTLFTKSGGGLDLALGPWFNPGLNCHLFYTNHVPMDVVSIRKTCRNTSGCCHVQLLRDLSKFLQEKVNLGSKMVHLTTKMEENMALLRLFLPEACNLNWWRIQ